MGFQSTWFLIIGISIDPENPHGSTLNADLSVRGRYHFSFSVDVSTQIYQFMHQRVNNVLSKSFYSSLLSVQKSAINNQHQGCSLCRTDVSGQDWLSRSETTLCSRGAEVMLLYCTTSVDVCYEYSVFVINHRGWDSTSWQEFSAHNKDSLQQLTCRRLSSLRSAQLKKMNPLNPADFILFTEPSVAKLIPLELSRGPKHLG